MGGTHRVPLGRPRTHGRLEEALGVKGHLLCLKNGGHASSLVGVGIRQVFS